MKVRGVVLDLISTFNSTCPKKITEKLGIKVMYFDLPQTVSAYSTNVDNSRYIVVNDNLLETEKIEALTRELAYYVLTDYAPLAHFSLNHSVHSVPNKLEREINIFTELLLNKKIQPQNNHILVDIAYIL